MTDEKIYELIAKLDTSSFTNQEKYWTEIKKLDINIPHYFLNAYPNFKKWQGRVHLVFSCVKYARKSEDAFQLGIKALSDKATLVRYRGASILAYSLREDAIPHLKTNLTHPDEQTQKDAERAIRSRNHHIFMEDRADKWIVNGSIDETELSRKNNPNGIFERIKSLIKGRKNVE